MKSTTMRAGLVGAAMTVTAAIVGSAGTGTAVAAGATDCTTRATQAAFSAWGDPNQYFLAPGGGFEAGTTPWALGGGASVVAGNEPWSVGGGGSSSARIAAGASITSPTFCVASDEDSLRLVYRSPGVSGAGLHVAVRVVSGANVATNELTLDGSTPGWTVGPRMMLPDIRDASGRQYVTITVSTRNAGATWDVDDVMIDPWKTR